MKLSAASIASSPQPMFIGLTVCQGLPDCGVVWLRLKPLQSDLFFQPSPKNRLNLPDLAPSSSAQPDSDQGTLDFSEGALVMAPVVEPGGAGAFMVDHLLGNFDLFFTAQVFGEAGGAERVLLDTGLHIGIQAAQSSGKYQLGFGAWLPACQCIQRPSDEHRNLLVR